MEPQMAKFIYLRMNLWSVEHFMNISFIKIRFYCDQNIGETLTQCKKSVFLMLWLQENLDERNEQLIRGSFLNK